MNETLKRCRGLVGLVFGHKFKPRYDSEVLVPDSTAAQVKEVWTKMVERAASMPLMPADYVSGVTRSLEALRSSVETHTHDVCVRCGQVVPAPPKAHAQNQARSVVRRWVEKCREAGLDKPAPAPPSVPRPAPPITLAPKLVVVPVRAAPAAAVPLPMPNPVQAVPHPKR